MQNDTLPSFNDSLTERQTAARLGLSQPGLAALREAGRAPTHLEFAGRGDRTIIRYSVEAVENFIRQHCTVGPDAAASGEPKGAA